MTAMKPAITTQAEHSHMGDCNADISGPETLANQDEIVLIEHLPGRRVHLQDFFWTGAEDAPSWLDPDQAINFYETRTVHHTATVYVTGEDSGKNGDLPGGGHQEPGCISCIEPTPTLIDPDQDIGVLVGDDPGPRYWLLTVLRAGENVPPKVELKLARLYRAAFARQQQRHLGLLLTDPRLRRATKKHGALDGHKSLTGMSNDNGVKNLMKSLLTTGTAISISEISTSSSNLLNETSGKKRMRQVRIIGGELIKKNSMNIEENSSNQIIDESTLLNNSNYTNDDINSIGEVSSLAPIVSLKFDDAGLNGTLIENGEITKALNLSSNKSVINPQPLRSNSGFYPDFTMDEFEQSNSVNTTSSDIFIYDKNFNINTVNISDDHSDEILKQYAFNNSINQKEINSSSRLRTAGIGIVQVRMQNTTVLNDGSTRLIYSVHLGGKPVPAETAAKDMALLSPQEVALELGAPVIIQSEPYLKESRPLALSRSRDAWLLLGAGGAGLAFLIIIIAGLVITAKRKRAHSAVSVPPTQSILKKERGYTSTTSGLDNTGYTSETEGRTDGTSQRQTPVSVSRTTPITSNTPATMDDDIQELSSDNDEEQTKKSTQETWDIEDYPTMRVKSRMDRKIIKRSGAIDTPGSPDSMDTVVECHEQREIIDNGCVQTVDETASPHSYLSMPSCKLFPSMRTVEPLSRILEPVVIRHLDMEFETPEMSRRDNGFERRKSSGIESLTRTRSALKDPGVVGPIVWDLRKHSAVEESTDVERQLPSSGPVGRARRRLHELLEDSFNLFSARDVKTKENVISSSLRPNSAAISSDRVTMFSESKETSTHVSPNASPKDYSIMRPRTSLSRNGLEEVIPETGNTGPSSRSAWGTRPMSAGPFHRPNLPEVNVTRILADSHLIPDDPAVPLIAAIKKELDKFTPEISRT
ncbi:hypothetical protein PV327_004787 [Microctonus hyperodae]|uniref:Uncharacterized protein n=1 Tax=Microctonus hyperodae TaxID=165561 RepID=A0AA39KMX3_MICHY|nr:hypothetical protein PV327_004787 [Microctonus hyperodae]